MTPGWLLQHTLLLCVFLSLGCTRSPQLPPDIVSPYPDLGISVSNFPRIDGSSSAEPLARFIACKILVTGYEWRHEPDDTSRLWPETVIAGRFAGIEGERPVDVWRRCEHINYLVDHNGTHSSYVNLLNREVDLIFVVRHPSDEEVQLAARNKVRLEITPIAMDAFVLLLNVENPVDSLTIEQIRDIYSGRLTNWQEIGGIDAGVQPYQRNTNSGSQQLMLRLVMKDREMVPAPEMLGDTGVMGYPFWALESDVNGIAYSVFYYQDTMSPLHAAFNVKLCAIDDVLPSSETIASGEYPFSCPIYAVIRQETAADAVVRRLCDWVIGTEGQALVQEIGTLR